MMKDMINLEKWVYPTGTEKLDYCNPAGHKILIKKVPLDLNQKLMEKGMYNKLLYKVKI